MQTLLRSRFMLLGVLFNLMMVAPSFASELNNGNFETGSLNGWNAEGSANAANEVAAIAPAEGQYQAVLRLAPGIAPASLESWLGLPAESLNQLVQHSSAYRGSAIKQTIQVQEGQTLTVVWRVAADSAQGTSGFISLTNADANLPAFTSLSTLDTSTGHEFQTFTYTFAEAGTYTLGIGLLGQADDATAALLIDDVQLSTKGKGGGGGFLALPGLGGLVALFAGGGGSGSGSGSSGAPTNPDVNSPANPDSNPGVNLPVTPDVDPPRPPRPPVKPDEPEPVPEPITVLGSSAAGLFGAWVLRRRQQQTGS